MRVMAWIVAATLLAALSTPAIAQDDDDDQRGRSEPKRVAKLHEQAPEIEAKFENADGNVSLERYRGRIILLFFFKSTDSASVEAMPRLNTIHEDYGDKGVVVIGLTPETKQSAESVVRGKRVRFIIGYEAETEESWNVSAFPLIYMVDTDGILEDRFHPDDRLEDKLQMQMRKTPPPGADPQALQNKFARASEVFREKEYGRAYTLASDVQKLVDGQSSLGKAVGKLIDDLEEAAKRWVEEARQATDAREYDRAARILAELKVRFAGTEIVDDVEEGIGRLYGVREAKPKMDKALENAQAALLNDRAADHEAHRRFLEALRLYRRAAEDYPNSEAGKASDAAIERIAANEEAQTIIRKRREDEQADRWLDIAERFRKVEMYGKAREYYDRILEDLPETRAASRARQRLQDLPKPEPEEEVEEEELAGEDEPDARAGR